MVHNIKTAEQDADDVWIRTRDAGEYVYGNVNRRSANATYNNTVGVTAEFGRIGRYQLKTLCLGWGFACTYPLVQAAQRALGDKVLWTVID